MAGEGSTGLKPERLGKLSTKDESLVGQGLARTGEADKDSLRVDK